MRTIPPEQRAKISAALKGRKLSPETRAKMSAAARGRPKSAEQCAKMKANYSDERRAKMSALFLGRPRPPEVRAKISASQMGNRYMRDASVKGECIYCFGPAQTHDHMIPRGRPGWDDPSNIVLACNSCNGRKSDRTPQEWIDAILAGRG